MIGQNELFFLFASLLLLSAATAVLRWWMDFAQTFLTLLMVVISVMATAPLHAFGLTSNLGCCLYGTVIFMFGVSTAQNGIMRADVAVAKVFFALLTMQGLFWIYRINPAGLSDELLYTTQVAGRTLVASYLAFVGSVAIVIRLTDLWKEHWWGIGAACFVAQFADSCTFFPMSFWGTGVDVWGYLWSGLLLKWCVTLMAAPFGEWLLAQDRITKTEECSA